MSTMNPTVMLSGTGKVYGRTQVLRDIQFDAGPALVDRLQELPNVFDVAVGERVVVVAPVHPLTQPARAVNELAGRP
jgi:hypothetical protein